MTATVTELLAAGSTPAPLAVRQRRAWMQPGVPLTIGRDLVVEIQLSIVADQCVPRLIARGRPLMRTLGHLVRRLSATPAAVTLEANHWAELPGYDVSVRPIAMVRSDHGRPAQLLVEFAALTQGAAAGWPS